MSRPDKKPLVIINLLKSDNKYQIYEPDEFPSNTSITIPKNIIYSEIKPEAKIERKTRDSNKNIKSYAQLENIKIPV